MPRHKTWAFAVLAAFASSQTPVLAQDGEPAIVIVSAPESARDSEGVAEDAPRANTVTGRNKVAKRRPANPVPVPKLTKAQLEQSVQCLALNIYHEARSESTKGQQAVAAVTLNRVASKSFPNSVCKVVKQGGKKRNKCQFSWWCDKHSDKPREASAWDNALELSRKTLNGQVSDPTNGALYYHANYVKPKWARTFKRTSNIGRHLFYKPQGA